MAEQRAWRRAGVRSGVADSRPWRAGASGGRPARGGGMERWRTRGAGCGGGARRGGAMGRREAELRPAAEEPGRREEDGGPRPAAWRGYRACGIAPDIERAEPNGKIAQVIESAAAANFLSILY